LRSKSSNTRVSKQEAVASPFARALQKFKVEQNGTSISLMPVETRIDRDVIKQFLAETGILNYRVIDLEDRQESIIQLTNFEDCENLIDLLRVSGVRGIQTDYSLKQHKEFQQKALSLSKHASPDKRYVESANQHVWSVLRSAGVHYGLGTKTAQNSINDNTLPNKYTFTAKSLDQKDRRREEEKQTTTESERFSYIPPLECLQQIHFPQNLTIDQMRLYEQSVIQQQMMMQRHLPDAERPKHAQQPGYQMPPQHNAPPMPGHSLYDDFVPYPSIAPCPAPAAPQFGGHP
jgi:hypothetical protein